jgi:DNA (cytosine-5)-methyltransferase 1
MVSPTALSLFSGIGGFCEGVKLAGFEVVGAVEYDKYACENYRLNFPSVPLFEGNIADFLPSHDPKVRKQHFSQYIKTKNLDLLFGGPPCQGYSQIGPRDVGDPRNELYLEMVRLADTLRPKFILMENVPNMLLMKNGMFKKRIIKALTKIGYDNIAIMVLNAADYGVPQARKRVFIAAAESTVFQGDLNDLVNTVASSLQSAPVSVHQAISDLPAEVVGSGEVCSMPAKRSLSKYQLEMRLDSNGQLYSKTSKVRHYKQIEQKNFLHNHHTKEIQKKRSDLIKLLQPGKKADSLPKSVWNNARPEKWRRFDGNEPAHTLLAQMHRDLSEWIHYSHHRWITVREALRLQSFHDGFVLKTSEWQQYKQIGNAVPPLLGRVPATAIKIALGILSGEISSSKFQSQMNLFTLDTAA